MIEKSKEGKSSLMEETDQLVAAMGCSEIDTLTHAEQNKEEQPVQAKRIMTSVTTTPAINDEYKDDPQNKVDQPVIEGDSSLLNLMAAYSEDEE